MTTPLPSMLVQGSSLPSVDDQVHVHVATLAGGGTTLISRNGLRKWAAKACSYRAPLTHGSFDERSYEKVLDHGTVVLVLPLELPLETRDSG